MRDVDTQNDQTINLTPHSTLDIPHSSLHTSQQIILQFENKIFSVVNNYQKGAAFLASVSGGADSMAMLAALCSLSKQSEFNFKISVCHIEHGIRPAKESCGDADFVRAFCESNGIDCRIKHFPQGRIAAFAQRKGCGIEAAAHHFRHKALRKIAVETGENTVILFAHTKDDLLETILMRVLRGAGPAGLAAFSMSNEELGIRSEEKAHSTLHTPHSTFSIICRPLLALSRSDVIDYLKAKNITWREDSTNADENYLRNKIRHRLVPLLNEFFPTWKKGTAALAQTQSLVTDFLVSEAASLVKWKENNEELQMRNEDLITSSIHHSSSPNSLKTNEKIFFAQPQIIREEAVFIGINKLSSSPFKIPLKSIKRSVIRRFCAGEINSADLGIVRIKKENEEVLIIRARKEFFEKGISKLI